MTHHEGITSQRCENFSLSFLYIFRVYMGLHLTCKSMKLLFKCQSSSIWPCKTECKGLFRSRKACKHHRTTLRKLVNEKRCFFHFCHIALACINSPFLFCYRKRVEMTKRRSFLSERAILWYYQLLTYFDSFRCTQVCQILKDVTAVQNSANENRFSLSFSIFRHFTYQ